MKSSVDSHLFFPSSISSLRLASLSCTGSDMYSYEVKVCGIPPYFCLLLWPLGKGLAPGRLLSGDSRVVEGLVGDEDFTSFSSLVLSSVWVRLCWRKSGWRFVGSDLMPEKLPGLNALITDEHSVPWWVWASVTGLGCTNVLPR